MLFTQWTWEAVISYFNLTFIVCICIDLCVCVCKQMYKCKHARVHMNTHTHTHSQKQDCWSYDRSPFNFWAMMLFSTMVALTSILLITYDVPILHIFYCFMNFTWCLPDDWQYWAPSCLLANCLISFTESFEILCPLQKWIICISGINCINPWVVISPDIHKHPHWLYCLLQGL